MNTAVRLLGTAQTGFETLDRRHADEALVSFTNLEAASAEVSAMC